MANAVIREFKGVLSAIATRNDPNDASRVNIMPFLRKPILGDVEKAGAEAVFAPCPKDVESPVPFRSSDHCVFDGTESDAGVFEDFTAFGFLFEATMVVGKLRRIRAWRRSEAEPENAVIARSPVGEEREDTVETPFPLTSPESFFVRF